jgi:hypothetical protein
MEIAKLRNRLINAKQAIAQMDITMQQFHDEIVLANEEYEKSIDESKQDE